MLFIDIPVIKTRDTNELMVISAIITPSLIMIALGIVVILGLIGFYMKHKLKIEDEAQAINMDRSTLPRYTIML